MAAGSVAAAMVADSEVVGWAEVAVGVVMAVADWAEADWAAGWAAGWVEAVMEAVAMAAEADWAGVEMEVAGWAADSVAVAMVADSEVVGWAEVAVGVVMAVADWAEADWAAGWAAGWVEAVMEAVAMAAEADWAGVEMEVAGWAVMAGWAAVG